MCMSDATNSKELKSNPHVNTWTAPHRGLSSGCRQPKLTTGICRLLGRVWSPAGLMLLAGSSGERRGEHKGERRPRPSLTRGGTLGRGECSPSDPDPSSSSLMDGSFLMIPPLLSQSAWGDSFSHASTVNTSQLLTKLAEKWCNIKNAKRGRCWATESTTESE